MKLWRISQHERTDYDTYDSAVVAAPDEGAARVMHPGGPLFEDYCASEEKDDARWGYRYGCWATHPDNVNVEYLGEAAEDTKRGVICASFNAG